MLGLWGGSWKCFSLTRFGVLLLCLDYFIEKKKIIISCHLWSLMTRIFNGNVAKVFYFGFLSSSNQFPVAAISFVIASGFYYWSSFKTSFFSTQLTAVKLMHQVFNQNSSSYSIRWHWLRFCKQNSTKSLTLQFDTHELQVESSLQTRKRFWLKENHRCSLKP